MGIVTTLYIGLLLLGQVHVHTVGDHVGSRSKNSKHYPRLGDVPAEIEDIV